MTFISATGVAPEDSWYKSSYSGGTGNNCVEVAHPNSTIYVRDSKNSKGPVLALAPETWSSFIGLARSGEIDLS
ncbi:DUF397 domain-containing protein [Streptomyces sp. NPDC039016]|uniref:DUF397 domain-containing protein n=1 Tax=Streptomyces sp. NPDC039016 TaxID=3154330 RepID=UPI0033EC44DE